MRITQLFILMSALLTLQLHAISLNSLITTALAKNPSLQALEMQVKATTSRIYSAKQFDNPTLSYTQNSIDPSEPMQQKTLTLRQKIHFYGKRDASENTALADKVVLQTRVQEAKVKLVQEIKTEAYHIWELEKLYEIICEYEDITRQNIALAEAYTSTTDNQHMGIMSAELTLSDLRIQKSALKADITSSYAKLTYLASTPIKTLDIILHVRDLPSLESLHNSLKNNPQIRLRTEEISQSKTLLESSELESYPDVTLLAGYAYRENFDDFFNLGISLSLPLYGTESYQEEAMRQNTLAQTHRKDDTLIAVNSELEQAYAQMRSAYEIFHIVQDEALPQIAHMFELSNASISTGADLFKYTDILVQKLKLEQKSISATASFYRYKAIISALSGEIQ